MNIVGPSRAMIAQRGAARRRALKVCALATGLADKAVSLFYERVLHEATSEQWIARCRMQIADVLSALEVARREQNRLLVRRSNRPCRYRRRLRTSLHARGPSWAVR